jgi:hypothetical protein
MKKSVDDWRVKEIHLRRLTLFQSQCRQCGKVVRDRFVDREAYYGIVD